MKVSIVPKGQLNGKLAIPKNYTEAVNTPYIIVDANGNEIPAVLVSEETVFTATENDIRLGTVAATEKGVTEGKKDIPAYHTTEGIAVVTEGGEFDILIPRENRYDFTKMQAILCPFNESLANSVAADKVAINRSVYAVGSADALATISVDHENKKIKLGITNNGATPFVIRYFTYKEEY